MASYDFETAAPRRGTRCIKWDTVPEGVIPLSIADADWPTAPAVLDAVRERLGGRPVFGYGRDDAGLADAVADWYRRKYALDVPREWLIVINGIVPALARLANLAGGGVLALTPNYSMLLAAPALAGKRLEASPMPEIREGAGPGALAYAIDYQDLAAKAEAASILYLCNPHNPIGKSYTRAELEALAAFARERGLVTVSDEIHCEIAFDKPHVPWFAVAPERSVTLIAPGKVCNMPGIPVGVAVIPDERTRRDARGALGHGNPGALNMAAGRGAFSRECDGWKAALLAHLARNRDYLEGELRRRLPRARFTHAEGTFLTWVDFSAYVPGDAQRFLLERARVALTPGPPFGGGEGHARVNFATSRALLAEALDRIEAALGEAQR